MSRIEPDDGFRCEDDGVGRLIEIRVSIEIEDPGR